MKIFFIDANNSTPQLNYPIIETISKYDDVDITYFSSDFSEHTNYYDKNYRFKKCYIFSKTVNKVSIGFIRKLFKLFSYSISSKLILLKAIFKKPDIVHYNWIINPFFDYIMISFFKIFGAKVVITQHNYIQHGKKNLRIFEKRLFKKVDNIICLSNYIADKFGAEFKNKITVIEHGNPYEKEIALYNTDKHNSKKIKILFIGGIFPYKGIELLINALSELNNKNILLYILGRGNNDYITYLKKILIMNDFASQTYFDQDYQSYQAILGAIQNSTLGVLPYKEASQSGIPYLFFNMHKPLVVTDAGALKEQVDRRFSKVCKPNAESIKQAISDLINDINLGKIKDDDFDDFLSKNLWSDTVAKYYEFYKKITKS